MALSWNQCVICQKHTTEELRCPLRASGDRADPKAVYSLFLKNAVEFNAVDALPVPLSLPLDTDAEVLVEKGASWHKSCHLQFSSSKLKKAKERIARKRKMEQAEQDDEEVQAQKHEGCPHGTIKKTVYYVERVANFTKSLHTPLTRSSAK